MTPPPDPLAGFKGPTSKERKKVGQRKRKKVEGKRKGEGKGVDGRKGSHALLMLFHHFGTSVRCVFTKLPHSLQHKL